MADRSITAKLIIDAEDRASKIVAQVTKAAQQFAKDADMSATMRKNAEAAAKTEAAFNAVSKAMAGREGFAKAQADAKAAEVGLAQYTKALDAARQAKAAFGNVKPAKGTDEATAYAAATKGLREATVAQQRAAREVERTGTAMRGQAAAMKEADAAAAKFGVDLSNLAGHQQHLKGVFEATTAAMGREIQMQDRAAAAAKRHAHEQAEYARHVRQHGVVNLAATAASGYVGVHGVIHTAERAAHAGAEVQRERVRLEAAGVPVAERKHIADESLRLATEAKNVTQAGVMELWKEMRSVMTDPHEVDHIIGPMVKAKSILDAGDSTGTASHGLGLLIKGAESIGAAKDPERFTHLLDGYVKAMQVMGKTITPEGIYEMQKYSKAAGARWTDRFILTTAQSLGQEMGGSTAGNAIQMAQKQIVGGMQNLHSKAKEFARIGLIDEKNLDYLKTGEVKGVKAGVKHAVKGDDLAATDLDKWVYTILLPALNKAGVKKEGDQLAWIQKNFTSTAADVISKMVTQRESFEAHAKMYEGASGLKGQALNRDDAIAGLQAVGKSLETFAGVVTGPVMKDAAHGLDAIASRIGSFSTSLEAFNKAHPDIAKYEGPAAAGIAVAGAGGASALIYKALSSGFGLSGSAAALNTSAAALDAAAIKLAGGKVPEAMRDAAVATTAGAGATFGLGGIIVAGGAVAGAVADQAGTVNAQGAYKAITGEETDGARLIRENHEMLERQKTLKGQAEELAQRLETERGVYGRLKTAKEGGSAVDGPLADAGARIARWEEELTALDAKIKALGQTPMPPPRPDMFKPITDKAQEAGTQAGQSIAEGVQTQAPAVEQQGRGIMRRLQELFSAGIFVPIHLKSGEGMGGEGGSGGLIQRASFGTGGGVGDGISTGGGGGGGLVRGGGMGGVGGGYGGGGGDGLKGGSAFEGARTANQMEAYRAARAAGLSDLAARVLVANVSGESIDNPADHHQDGPHTAEGIWQHDPSRAAAIAKHFGKRLRDMSVTEQMQAGLWEMRTNPAYRRSWNALQGGDPAAMLRTIIGNHERPQDEGAAFRHRMKLFNRFDPNAVASGGDASALRVKGGLGGQAFAGGPNHGAMIEVAKLLQGGGGVDRFTAFNDRHHAGTNSLHARGLAMDVTGDAARIMANARAAMEVAGLVEGKDYKLIDEYRQRSGRWTGGHVDFRFLSRGAADRFSETFGKRVGRREGAPDVPAGPAGFTVPEAPPAGLGGGRSGMQAAAERMHAAAERFENAAFHGQVDVRLLGPGRSQGRITGMRSKGRGMTADMGVSMPGAKESDDDWS